MPLGKICWMLWFSSMITRILRSLPESAAGLNEERAACCERVALMAALAVVFVAGRPPDAVPVA
jgi:hypothetical protein